MLAQEAKRLLGISLLMKAFRYQEKQFLKRRRKMHAFLDRELTVPCNTTISTVNILRFTETWNVIYMTYQRHHHTILNLYQTPTQDCYEKLNADSTKRCHDEAEPFEEMPVPSFQGKLCSSREMLVSTF